MCDVCYQKRTPSNGPLTDLCEELAEEVSQKHYCDLIIVCLSTEWFPSTSTIIFRMLDQTMLAISTPIMSLNIKCLYV